MIKYCKKQWDANKERLENAIRTDENLQVCNYEYLLKIVVTNILNAGIEEYDGGWSADKSTVIDDGDYQGTLLFLIPREVYQPSEYEYLMTYVSYGSCSGCDTLLDIQSWGWGSVTPTDEQVTGYMELCKDLVTRMIRPYNNGWFHDEEYDTVDF